MIKIPQVIDIGGISYEIRWVAELQGKLAAQIFFRDGYIEIDENLSDEVAFVSFLHEVQHGIFGCQNYDINKMLYHDEGLVERSAQLWGQVIKQIVGYNSDCAYADGLLAPECIEDKTVLDIDVPGF